MLNATQTQPFILNMSKTRYTVLDSNDRFIGVWYATSEVAAIQAALAAGYDAWSAGDGSHRKL